MFIILFYIIKNINIIKNIINIKNKYLFFMIFIWCISVYLSIFNTVWEILAFLLWQWLLPDAS